MYTDQESVRTDDQQSAPDPNVVATPQKQDGEEAAFLDVEDDAAAAETPLLAAVANAQAAQADAQARWRGNVGQYKRMRTDAISRQAAIDAARAESQAQELDEAASDRAQYDMRREEAIRQADARVRAAQERAADIDRNTPELRDYWADKSTGTKVAAAIAIGLGAFGAGAGRNDVLDIINGAVRRDFDMQRARIEEMRDRSAMARTGIKDAEAAKQRLLDDVNLSEAMAMRRITDKWKSTRLRQFGGDEAALKRDQQLAALELETARLTKNAVGGPGLRTFIAAQRELARQQAVLGKQRAADEKARAAMSDRSVYGADGDEIAQAPNAKSAARANQILTGLRTVNDTLDRLGENYAKHGRVMPGSEAAQERASLASHAVAGYKELWGLGVLSGSDMGMVNNATGGGAAFYTFDPATKIATSKSKAFADAVSRLDQLGLPGKQIVARVMSSRAAQAAPSAQAAEPAQPGVRPAGLRKQVNRRTGAVRYVDAAGNVYSPDQVGAQE